MEKSKNPDDVRRYNEFRQWVREQANLKGWDMDHTPDRRIMADNFNAARDDTEKPIGEAAYRMLVQRHSDLATVRRDTCLMVSRGLLLDYNDVLWAAGYQREDGHLQVDELPTRLRVKYGDLDERHRAAVHRCIDEQYAAQAERQTPSIIPLPDNIQRLYDTLTDASRRRVQRFIRFEHSESGEV